jgi:acetyltransferase
MPRSTAYWSSFPPKLDDDPAAVAKALVLASANIGKPLLTCWMGDERVTEAREIINGAGIATFR